MTASPSYFSSFFMGLAHYLFIHAFIFITLFIFHWHQLLHCLIWGVGEGEEYWSTNISVNGWYTTPITFSWHQFCTATWSLKILRNVNWRLKYTCRYKSLMWWFKKILNKTVDAIKTHRPQALSDVILSNGKMENVLLRKSLATNEMVAKSEEGGKLVPLSGAAGWSTHLHHQMVYNTCSDGSYVENMSRSGKSVSHTSCIERASHLNGDVCVLSSGACVWKLLNKPHRWMDEHLKQQIYKSLRQQNLFFSALLSILSVRI